MSAATSPAPRRVLILKPCCLGDVLLATPLAATVASAWPACRVDWAVGSHSLPALAGNPHVAERIDASGSVRGELSARALTRLVVALRVRRYDLALVPDRSPVLALVARLAGIPRRVGLDSGGRGRRHTVRVPAPPDRHEAELYLDLARAIGLAPAPPVPRFFPSGADRAAAERILAEADVKPEGARAASNIPEAARRAGPWIAIHPGGGVNPGMALLSKRWPADRFAAVAAGMVGRWGARIAVLGAAGDAVASRGMVDALPPEACVHVHDLTGRLSFGAAAAVIERCALYVGNDSGVAHLAAAVGTPVVVVFGPTRPERYGPPPGRGVAVAPPGGAPAADRLADAAGSTAIGAVTVDAVWHACEAAMAVGRG